ncbi:MAG: rod shape-determining protein MreD [Bacillota bacterium]|nr:MAG: rod shape-determining protein MreD [Bacillota bacterium]MBS3949103.1 rod shape-determining protein MreD [Peptococcaceae bacterium]
MLTLVVLSVVLHGALMPYLTIFGGRLNLLVAVVAGIALYYGTWVGMLTGLCTGLLADVVLGHVLGLSAVPLVLIGFFTGQLERRVYRDAFLVPVFVGLSASATFEIVVLLLSRLAFGTWWRRAFMAAAIPTILINGAFMPLVFWFLGRILPRNKEV